MTVSCILGMNQLHRGLQLINFIAGVFLLPVVLLCSLWLIPWAIYALLKGFDIDA